jgi:hypothetical protein
LINFYLVKGKKKKNNKNKKQRKGDVTLALVLEDILSLSIGINYFIF